MCFKENKKIEQELKIFILRFLRSRLVCQTILKKITRFTESIDAKRDFTFRKSVIQLTLPMKSFKKFIKGKSGIKV